MIALALLTTYATYYSDGLMAQVASNRDMDLRGYVGGVAVNDCDDLGRAIWLEWEDGWIDGPFLVVDCAQRIHVGARMEAGYVVEVGADIARWRGFYGVGPKRVIMHSKEPPDVLWR